MRIKNPFRRSALPAKSSIPISEDDLDLGNSLLVRQLYTQMALPKREIEIHVADKDLSKALLARVIEQWEALSSEPFWSNDTTERYKMDQIDEAAKADFYGGGLYYMDVINAFASRCDVHIPEGVCLELGAGVGKHTSHLARRFKKVIAVDVAESLLDVSAQRNRKEGLNNVEYVVLKEPSQLGSFGNIDFFMAQSVLQHNPPPTQKAMLDCAFESLSPSGFTLFETPDWLEGYTFSAQAFLANPPDAQYDGHCYPKQDVIRLIKSHNMELLDFAPDFNVGCMGCYTYFARKVPRSAPP